MLNTEEIYNEGYCAYTDSLNWRYRLIPLTIAILYNYFDPESVIDVGCSNGIHLKAFRDLGVKRLFGIEGTKHWIPYIENNFGNDYLIADLRKPIKLDTKYDLVTSFEVLEHLEEESAIQAAKNLISFGNALCISANSSKRGLKHINAKPMEYWIDIFESLGVSYCKDDVDQLHSLYEKVKCSQWFKTGLMVFRKLEPK